MHFIITYNRKNGVVLDVKEYVDWKEAFKAHQNAISGEQNLDVSISLVDAPDKEYLVKNYGAFFHKKDTKTFK